MNLTKYLLLTFIAISLLASSCDKDDPEMINEEELITTVNVTCTPEAGGQDVVMSFRDLDGDGGDDPVITGGVLDTNTVYLVQIELLNESESPAEDITEEVREEGDEHQFFFATEAQLNLQFAYDDEDGDGNPIGIQSRFLTGAASSGLLQITLRHEPEKSNPGVNQGDITNANGETDIEVQLPVEIR